MAFYWGNRLMKRSPPLSRACEAPRTDPSNGTGTQGVADGRFRLLGHPEEDSDPVVLVVDEHGLIADAFCRSAVDTGKGDRHGDGDGRLAQR